MELATLMIFALPVVSLISCVRCCGCRSGSVEMQYLYHAKWHCRPSDIILHTATWNGTGESVLRSGCLSGRRCMAM